MPVIISVQSWRLKGQWVGTCKQANVYVTVGSDVGIKSSPKFTKIAQKVATAAFLIKSWYSK